MYGAADGEKKDQPLFVADKNMRLTLLATCVASAASLCARVNKAQSSGWLDRDQVTPRFSLQLDIVGHWVPFTSIAITWPDATEVNVEHFYNVEQVTAGDSIPKNAAMFRLGRSPATPANFVILGTGSSSMLPSITCSSESSLQLPPPSPPHALDCKLVPTYTTLNTWLGNSQTNAGDNVVITFRTWRDAGLVHLRYWGQTNLHVESPVGAMTKSTEVIDGATVITLQLGTSCEERVVDNQGIIVAQPGQTVNCVPHRAETMRVTFNLRPPALHPPQISCHEHEPPPPPAGGLDLSRTSVTTTIPASRPAVPQGSPTAYDAHVPQQQQQQQQPQQQTRPLPSPPPPPPALRAGSKIRSLEDCALGAEAYVVRVESHGATSTLRIEIRPEYWLEGYVFILGVTGSQLDIGSDVVRTMHPLCLPCLLCIISASCQLL